MNKTLRDIVNALRNPLPDDVGMAEQGEGYFSITSESIAELSREEIDPNKRCFVCAVGKIAMEWGFRNAGRTDLGYADFHELGRTHDVLSRVVDDPASMFRTGEVYRIISDLYENEDWSLEEIANWVESLEEGAE